jgi:hypothetical protein
MPPWSSLLRACSGLRGRFERSKGSMQGAVAGSSWQSQSQLTVGSWQLAVGSKEDDFATYLGLLYFKG